MYERRDNGDRNDMAMAALGFCRALRKTDGINSAKYYWSGTDSIGILLEGEGPALSSPGAGIDPADVKFAFDLGDAARQTMDIQLSEAKAGEETAKAAGRA
jgi:hypothetical protein